MGVFVLACQKDQAQHVIDQAIQSYGGARYESMMVQFDFRERHYTGKRDHGQYTYTREFIDTSGKVKDVLTNEGLKRYINGELRDIPAERATAYSNSVNSVLYFALLPFGLNDPAVNKTYLGIDTVKNQVYHLVKVTFDQQGGGKDHSDIFYYWFRIDDYQMNYFGYSYESDGGGVRFREAYNTRDVNGIVFQDYVNYKAPDDTGLDQLSQMFENSQLERLSYINLEKVSVATFN